MNTRRTKQKRPAFTLFELMLVLAVLVIVAAFAYPSFQKPLANQRLRKSAELVRSVWARARVDAMKTGRIQMFHYLPGGNEYYVQAWFAGGEETETDVTSTNMDSQTEAVNESLEAAQSPDVLPDGVTFLQDNTQFEARDADVIKQQTTGIGTSLDRPVLFYPDGSTSTTTLTLQNAIGYSINVKLRGLTGMSKTGELTSTAEVLE